MRMIRFENFSAPCPLFEGFRGQTTSREYDIRKPCRAGRGSGSRVSELRHITAEAVREGRAAVRNKGKTRVILIPAALRKLLLGYMKKTGVTTGSVFLSKNKTPLDRSTVWRRMKALCERAGGGPKQGLSPFSAASVRPRLLQRGKGPSAACGHPRPRQREHHAHLHHGNRPAMS